MEADVVVFATESEEQFQELQEFGTIGNLEAVPGDRAVYTDEVLAGAIYFDTPLSLEYVLESSRRCSSWPRPASHRTPSRTDHPHVPDTPRSRG